MQDSDNGTADNRWRFVPTGARRIQNLNSGLVLGVQDMSTSDGGLVIQWGDTGTADHLWTAVVDSGGYLRLRNSNSGKVLGVENSGTGNGARAGPGHRHRLHRPAVAAALRRQRRLPDPVRQRRPGLGVSNMSTSQGAQVLIWDDNGTNDHLWRFI